MEWISVNKRPLYEKTTSGWQCTEDGDKEFLAAIKESSGWWIRHCVVEDRTGLCVVGDAENEPAGYELEDVQYWMPLPEPPKQ